MRRKAVIKSQPKGPKPFVMSELAGKAHLHFCVNRECRLGYEDQCPTPEVNARCHTCRGKPRPVYFAPRDPQECCIGNCTQVTSKDTLALHKLAGPGPWFQCNTCARCHGWPCN